MPYSVQLPDGRLLTDIPDDVDKRELAYKLAEKYPELRKYLPEKPKSGILAGLGKGTEDLVSSVIGAGQAVFGDPTEAGRAAAVRGKAIDARYDNKLGLDRVKEAYNDPQGGLMAAAKEVVRQAPLFLAEQAPQLAGSIGAGMTGARVGALAGAPFGPAGATVGGIAGGALGAIGFSGMQALGSNVQRQAEVNPNAPVDMYRAVPAAIASGALDAVGAVGMLGKTTVAKLFGMDVQKLLAAGAKKEAEALAAEKLGTVIAKGGLQTLAAEVPTEVLQQVTERWNAGLPLLDDEAKKEYGETAYATMFMLPVGMAGRAHERSSARGFLQEQAAAEQAQKAAAQAKAAQEAAAAEAARKQSPEYLQELDGKYQAFLRDAQQMRAALGPKPDAKTDPSAAQAHTLQRTELAQFLKDNQDLVREHAQNRKAIDAMRAQAAQQAPQDGQQAVTAAEDAGETDQVPPPIQSTTQLQYQPEMFANTEMGVGAQPMRTPEERARVEQEWLAKQREQEARDAAEEHQSVVQELDQRTKAQQLYKQQIKEALDRRDAPQALKLDDAQKENDAAIAALKAKQKRLQQNMPPDIDALQAQLAEAMQKGDMAAVRDLSTRLQSAGVAPTGMAARPLELGKPNFSLPYEPGINVTDARNGAPQRGPVRTERGASVVDAQSAPAEASPYEDMQAAYAGAAEQGRFGGSADSAYDTLLEDQAGLDQRRREGQTEAEISAMERARMDTSETVQPRLFPDDTSGSRINRSTLSLGNSRPGVLAQLMIARLTGNKQAEEAAKDRLADMREQRKTTAPTVEETRERVQRKDSLSKLANAQLPEAERNVQGATGLRDFAFARFLMAAQAGGQAKRDQARNIVLDSFTREAEARRGAPLKGRERYDLRRQIGDVLQEIEAALPRMSAQNMRGLYRSVEVWQEQLDGIVTRGPAAPGTDRTVATTVDKDAVTARLQAAKERWQRAIDAIQPDNKAEVDALNERSAQIMGEIDANWQPQIERAKDEGKRAMLEAFRDQDMAEEMERAERAISLLASDKRAPTQRVADADLAEADRQAARGAGDVDAARTELERAKDDPLAQRVLDNWAAFSQDKGAVADLERYLHRRRTGNEGDAAPIEERLTLLEQGKRSETELGREEPAQQGALFDALGTVFDTPEAFHRYLAGDAVMLMRQELGLVRDTAARALEKLKPAMAKHEALLQEAERLKKRVAEIDAAIARRQGEGNAMLQRAQEQLEAAKKRWESAQAAVDAQLAEAQGELAAAEASLGFAYKTAADISARMAANVQEFEAPAQAIADAKSKVEAAYAAWAAYQQKPKSTAPVRIEAAQLPRDPRLERTRLLDDLRAAQEAVVLAVRAQRSNKEQDEAVKRFLTVDLQYQLQLNAETQEIVAAQERVDQAVDDLQEAAQAIAPEIRSANAQKANLAKAEKRVRAVEATSAQALAELSRKRGALQKQANTIERAAEAARPADDTREAGRVAAIQRNNENRPEPAPSADEAAAERRRTEERLIEDREEKLKSDKIVSFEPRRELEADASASPARIYLLEQERQNPATTEQRKKAIDKELRRIQLAKERTATTEEGKARLDKLIANKQASIEKYETEKADPTTTDERKATITKSLYEARRQLKALQAQRENRAGYETKDAPTRKGRKAELAEQHRQNQLEAEARVAPARAAELRVVAARDALNGAQTLARKAKAASEALPDDAARKQRWQEAQAEVKASQEALAAALKARAATKEQTKAPKLQPASYTAGPVTTAERRPTAMRTGDTAPQVGMAITRGPGIKTKYEIPGSPSTSASERQNVGRLVGVSTSRTLPKATGKQNMRASVTDTLRLRAQTAETKRAQAEEMLGFAKKRLAKGEATEQEVAKLQASYDALEKAADEAQDAYLAKAEPENQKRMRKLEKTRRGTQAARTQATIDEDVEADDDIGGALRSEGQGDTPLSAAGKAAADAPALLRSIIDTTDDAFTRSLAQRLLPLVDGMRVQTVDVVRTSEGEHPNAPGGIVMAQRLIQLKRGVGQTEDTAMHELLHAATLHALSLPDSRLTPAQRTAKRELVALHESLRNQLDNAVIRDGDVREFVAEALGSRRVAARLQAMPTTGFKNAWDRFKNWVLNLLGRPTPPQPGNMRDRLLALTEPFMTPHKGRDTRGEALRSAAQSSTKTATQEFAEAMIARKPSLKERLFKNFGLTAEMQLVDMRAPLMKALSKGDQQAYEQVQYLVRKADQRMAMTQAALAHGPLGLRKDDRGFFVVEGGHGPSAKTLFEAIGSVPIADPAERMAAAQAYLTAQRAANVGWEKLGFDNADRMRKLGEAVMAQVKADPALEKALQNVRSVYNEYNKGLISFLGESGAIPKAEAQRLLARGDYVPFYRVTPQGNALLDLGEGKTLRIGDLRNQPYLQALEGDDEKLLPLNEAVIRNTMLLTDMAMRNLASRNVGYALQNLSRGADGSLKMPVKRGKGPADIRAVRFRQEPEAGETGEEAGWRHVVINTNGTLADGVSSELLAKSIEGTYITLTGFSKVLAKPADILRAGVTRSPAYLLRQLTRDPIAASFTSGVDTGMLRTLGRTWGEFAKQVTGNSATGTELLRKGLIHSGTFTGDPDDMSKIALQLSAGDQGAWQKLLARADHLAMAADASTRAKAYESFRKQGLSEMQAELAAMEMMNFNKRGAAATIQQASRLIPFLNAQIQGLNVLFKSMRGNMPLEDKLRIQEKFRNRAMLLTAMTLAYAAAWDDDDTYKNAPAYTRYSNFFVRVGDTTYKVPIPFEVGFLFKAIPEMALDALKGKFGETEWKAAKSLFFQQVPGGMAPVPQVVKPILEVATNHSFFTGRELESYQQQQLSPTERYGARTTEVAKWLSQMLNAQPVEMLKLSPIQIETLARGYFGTIPIAVGMMANSLFEGDNSAARPTPRASETPLFGAFVQERFGGGPVDQAYTQVKAIEQAKATYEKMVKEGRRADAERYRQDVINLMTAGPISERFREAMSALSKQEAAVRNSDRLDADAKRERLDKIIERRHAVAERFNQAVAAVAH